MTPRLTVDKVAAVLRRNPELVRRWLREGSLRGERIGWSWTVTRSELDRFMRKQPSRRKR
jgi:excisionase family DNA binding protein